MVRILMAYKIIDTNRGLAGEIHEIEVKEGNVLLFVVPRYTRHMNESYRDEAKRAAQAVLPDGKQALIVGSDVDVYELCGEDALTLVLKGIMDDKSLQPLRKKNDK